MINFKEVFDKMKATAELAGCTNANEIVSVCADVALEEIARLHTIISKACDHVKKQDEELDRLRNALADFHILYGDPNAPRPQGVIDASNLRKE